MTVNNHCKKCSALDDERMVQCDDCDHWFHFDCVGVDSRVADDSWSCDSCKNCGNAVTEEHRVSQARGPAMDGKQPVASSSPLTSTQAVCSGGKISTLNDMLVDVPQTTDQSQQQLLSHNTTSRRDFAPSKTVRSYEQNHLPTTTWSTAPSNEKPMSRTDEGYFKTAGVPQILPSSNYLSTNAQITGNNPIWSLGASSQTYVNAGVTQAPNFAATLSDVLPAATVHEQRAPTKTHFGDFKSAPKQNGENALPNRKLLLERLEEEMKIKQQYLDQKYRILSQEVSSECTAAMSSMLISGPTASQLAARQAIPRSLPTFSGDAEDWPLFISSYENSTAVAGFSDAENLSRLQTCLKGRARDIVKHKLYLPSMVPEIIKTLRMCFGRPEHILDRAIKRARGLPMIKDKLESLIEFALCVRDICATMESCDMSSHLQNPFLVKELVDKLPSIHKLSWAMYPKDGRIPIVKLFSDWLYQIAEAASTVVTLPSGKSSGSVNAHFTGDSDDEKTLQTGHNGSECKICGAKDHKISQCGVFKSASLDEKWRFVREKNICRQCLGIHRRQCFLKKICGVNSCSSKHHKLLHKYKPGEQAKMGTVDASELKRKTEKSKEADTQTERVNTHCRDSGANQTIFRVVPINVHSADKVIKTFAFLDEGSSGTLIDQSLYKNLGLAGERDPLCLRWSNNTTRVEHDSERVTVNISNGNSSKKFVLKNVHTVRNLDLPVQSIDFTALAKTYPHLTGLQIESYKHVKPKVLIGLNNWSLAVPLKVKEGAPDEPIATKTRLGWVVQGSGFQHKSEDFVNIHTCECQKGGKQLHEMVKEAFIIDASKPTQLVSKDDERALEILKRTCTKVNGRYEVGLTWRDSEVQLPNSYPNAHKRMTCLQKRFDKDPSLKQKIQVQIDNLIAKGYARKLSEDEIKEPMTKTWYLPIFIVTNPNKPNKLRLVWDAASKAKGASLNDFLLSGPDLLNSLMDVLMAFRIGEIAICADIEEMFHRINVRHADINAQRFLWLDNDSDKNEPSVYVMHALTFGLSCAPCIAHYIRNKNADEFEQQFPRAVKAIRYHHYVDDFIDSEESEKAAIELATQVKKIHASAGFNLKGWVSNSKRVLRELEDDETTTIKGTKEWGPITKVLGMFWDPSNDKFKYIFRFARLRRDVLREEVVPTKRETLQVLMSIFDPLGFVSCYTISLKILIQDIWRSGIDWDDLLNDSLYKNWCQWKCCLPLLAATEIPRCYSPDFPRTQNVQLHTFVDAGENAYAAVSYLRVETAENVSISIVAAKSKVAPVKPVSTPRLELQAAIIGVRLANQILQVKRIRTSLQFWWTDSKTVLRWLSMDPKNFKQHVMHRVGEILEFTNINQWRYVPTRLNPADFATKTTSKIKPHTWFSGPEFLKLQPNDWPQNEFESKEVDDMEIKHNVYVTVKICRPNVEYFSSWRRLYNAVATFILYIKKLKVNVNSSLSPCHVTSEIREQARQYLFKCAQHEIYSEEIHCLQNHKRIEPTSKLITMNVYLDNTGLLRSKGRAEHLNNHEDIIVLPNDHYVTFLLVRFFHETFHHHMHETVINTIRGQYHISRLRVLYGKVRRMCQWCKNNSATPKVPQMAPLPAARLAEFERPFTYVGLDYFGPYR